MDVDTKTFDLAERRAWFVYEAARLHAEADGAPEVLDPWDERPELFREQFRDVVVLMCATDRTTLPEDLPEEWDSLNPQEHPEDAVFVALCDVARLWITE